MDWHRAFIITAILLIGVECVSASSEVVADDQAQKAHENTAWTDLPDGNRVLDVRWAVGSPDTIVTLRIPKAYLGPFVGPGNCYPFGSAEPDIDCRYTFQYALPIRASMPEVGPPPPEDSADTIAVTMTSTALASPGETPLEILSGRLDKAVELQKLSVNQLKPLRGPGGLVGIGPVAKKEDASTEVGVRDIYYNGSTPNTSTVYLTCDDDDINRLVGFATGPDAPCDEFFVVPELKAIAMVSMRFKYIDKWNDIPDRVSRLLVSFILEH